MVAAPICSTSCTGSTTHTDCRSATPRPRWAVGSERRSRRSTTSSRVPRSRRWATMSRPTARRASTASPSCRSFLSTRSIAVCRATMPTTTRVSSKASSRPTKAPCASLRSTCRTAIRSTTSGSFPTSCHGWRGWSAGLKNGSGSRKRWCWPATTMSSPNRPTPGSPRTGGTTRCSSRRPGKPSAV